MNELVDPVRILIVDDSEDQQLLLRRYFERAGCDVVVAGTALDAIDFHREHNPDLTVIDLVLPGIDGWDLAERLSTSTPTGAIAITSVLSVDLYPPQHAALPKPVTGAHVRAALEALVPRWAAA